MPRPHRHRFLHAPSHREAEARWIVVRRLAYQLVLHERMNAAIPIPIRLGPIDAAVLDVWERVWLPAFAAREPLPHAHWNWRDLVDRNANRPARFEVAVWSDATLCGLACGRRSRYGTQIAVSHIAGSPVVGHPLKSHILDLALAAASKFGKIAEARQVRIDAPLPGTFGLYERAGYIPVWKRRVVGHWLQEIR